MCAAVYLIVFVGVFSAAFSKDIADRFERRPEENPDLFQGDIRLTPEQRAIIEEAESGQRKAIADLTLRWPHGAGPNARNAEVPYVIASGMSGTTKAAIGSAIDHWQRRTCVKFIPRTAQSDYIEFMDDDGCWSNLGRIGGKQQISIGYGCEYAGIVIHEIGHAIGFEHEHSRPDRDNFITINWNNIQTENKDQFNKEYNVVTHNVPYDVGSIMHYDGYAFTRNWLPTITANNPADEDKMGQREGLSDADIQLANAILCV